MSVKVKNLNTPFLSVTRVILVGGLTLFILGLLVILRLNPFFSLLTQVVPNTGVVEVVGVVSQFLEQALVVFGAMRSTSQA